MLVHTYADQETIFTMKGSSCVQSISLSSLLCVTVKSNVEYLMRSQLLLESSVRYWTALHSWRTEYHQSVPIAQSND